MPNQEYLKRLEITNKQTNNRNSFESVDELNKQAVDVRKSDNSLSLTLSKEAIGVAKLLGYPKGLAKAYYDAGISCRLSSNFEAAIEYFEEALKINRSIEDKHKESRTLNAIANVYYKLSDFKKAIEYYDESIFVLQIIGDLKFEAAVLTNRGLSYQQFGDLRTALNNYLESLSICRSLSLPVHYALYNNLGIVYLETGSYNESLKYFVEALKKTYAEKNSIDESYTLANLGRTYIYLEDYANAITYLTEALIIMKRFGDKQAVTQVFSNLGKAYMKMRCYPEAVKYYNRALKYYKEISDTSSVSHTLCEMGELYFEINDFKTSKEYFIDGLELSRKIDDVVNEVRTSIGLAKLYVKFKDEEKASAYLVKAEEHAKSRNAYKELSKISKIYSDLYAISGKRNEARESMERHYEYLKKMVNLEEDNKIHAVLLGHLSINENTKELVMDYLNEKKFAIFGTNAHFSVR